MFLGQLLYYEKELDRVLLSSDFSALLEIEIAGIDNLFLSELKNIQNSTEVLLELKERFLVGYEKILSENNLVHSLDFWKNISSPVYKLNIAKPATVFQAQVHSWVDSGAKFDTLKEDVLNIGRFATDEQDFAIYYGLHVLYKINSFVIGNKESLSAIPAFNEDQDNTIENLSEKSQIAVIGSLELEPLVSNINCVFIRNSDSPEILKENLLKVLRDNHEVSLVLVDSSNKGLLNELQKHKIEGVLFSEISFGGEIGGGFFDDIVKKTLGIRLS